MQLILIPLLQDPLISMNMMIAGRRLSGFLVLLILWAGEGSAQNVRKGPYLIFPGDNTRMRVLWQDDRTSVDHFRWGPDTSMANGPFPSVEYGTDHQHQYLFSALLSTGLAIICCQLFLRRFVLPLVLPGL